jgi:hypothetical protein
MRIILILNYIMEGLKELGICPKESKSQMDIAAFSKGLDLF